MSSIDMDHVHYQVHAGFHFSLSKTFAAVASAANADIRFKTGANPCHAVMDIAATGKANLLVYEAPTISAGTAMTVYNNNRKGTPTASTVTATHTPTVTAVGTTILLDKLLPSANVFSTAAQGATRNEFVLKPNTEYLIRVTNNSGAAADINTIVSFYEEV